MRAMFVPIVCVCLLGPLSGPVPADESPATAPAAAARATDVSLTVQSVKVVRASETLQRDFRGRYFPHEPLGVNMQVLLTFADTVILPPEHDAVTLDTFLDDTYQSLLGGVPQPNPGHVFPPMVSADGRKVLFVVSTSRPPADDAGRVFVRGTLNARASFGEPKVSDAPLPLTAGRQANVGPFRTTVRSVTDSAQGMLSLDLLVEGDADLIRSVRAVSADGRVLSSDQHVRLIRQREGEPGATIHMQIAAGSEDVRIEYAHADRVRDMTVPWEAQVDIGVVNAGPIQVVGAAGAGAGVERPWPPPPPRRVKLPDRRSTITPTTRPRDLDAAAVDVFSMTVGKPPPGDAPGAVWANPPAPELRASGFTTARLVVSTPGMRIVSVPLDAVSITRFEDDKAGPLPTEVYEQRTTLVGSRQAPVPMSKDGRQAVVTVSLPAAPRSGATRCTLDGTVKVRAVEGDRVDATEPLVLDEGQGGQAGPFEVTVRQVRQPVMEMPGQALSPELIVNVMIAGPVRKVQLIELLDGATRQRLARHTPPPESPVPGGDRLGVNLTVPRQDVEQVIVRVHHYDRDEVIEIPFEVTTGIGL